MLAILKVIALILICVYLKWSLAYWKHRKVDGPSGLPLVGSMGEYIMGRKHFGMVYHKIYSLFPTVRYVGFFKFTAPTLLIRDLNVVHDVMIKKQAAFGQNEFFVNEKIDPLIIQSPFVKVGEDWKKTRAMLSPAFTPGRVRQMYPIVQETVVKLLAHIEEHSADDIEAKNLCFKYTMENVASCAFGLNGNCFTDPENSEFFINGGNVFEPNLLFNLTTLFFPGLTKIISAPAISPRMDNWLRIIVGQVLEQRKKETEKRNDFLNFLLDLQEKRPEEFTKDTIVGNCLTFLTEGTETSSITLTYLLYELAKNPEIQQRLLDELNRITDNGKVDLNGELIGHVKYLDSLLEETLRLHSPGFSLQKICTQRTELEPQYENGKKNLIVEPGTRIVIPVWSIARDPNNFENPEKFDPDRFGRDNINKMALLAFGEGARLCLGKNFALFQVKMAVASVILKYRVVMADKMTVPPKISVNAFLLHCDTGIWLKFQARKGKRENNKLYK